MNEATFQPQFVFVEFHERRFMRGADAARVEVTGGDCESTWLWMSKKDIKANIAAFGPSDALTKALNAYEARKA